MKKAVQLFITLFLASVFTIACSKQGFKAQRADKLRLNAKKEKEDKKDERDTNRGETKESSEQLERENRVLEERLRRSEELRKKEIDAALDKLDEAQKKMLELEAQNENITPKQIKELLKRWKAGTLTAKETELLNRLAGNALIDNGESTVASGVPDSAVPNQGAAVPGQVITEGYRYHAAAEVSKKPGSDNVVEVATLIEFGTSDDDVVVIYATGDISKLDETTQLDGQGVDLNVGLLQFDGKRKATGMEANSIGAKVSASCKGKACEELTITFINPHNKKISAFVFSNNEGNLAGYRTDIATLKDETMKSIRGVFSEVRINEINQLLKDKENAVLASRELVEAAEATITAGERTTRNVTIRLRVDEDLDGNTTEVVAKGSLSLVSSALSEEVSTVVTDKNGSKLENLKITLSYLDSTESDDQHLMVLLSKVVAGKTEALVLMRFVAGTQAGQLVVDQSTLNGEKLPTFEVHKAQLEENSTDDDGESQDLGKADKSNAISEVDTSQDNTAAATETSEAATLPAEEEVDLHSNYRTFGSFDDDDDDDDE